jgi:hypothetical protein
VRGGLPIIRRMRATTSRHAARALAAAALAVGSAACAPALDWRELKTADGRLVFMLPCKPTVQERSVQLAGRAVMLALQACAAQGQTWGVASAEMGDPASVGPALAELARSAAANVRGEVSAERAARVPGATPYDASRHVELRGSQPGGQPVAMQLVVFAHGTRVFQATALGATIGTDAADTFFGALRIAAP